MLKTKRSSVLAVAVLLGSMATFASVTNAVEGGKPYYVSLKIGRSVFTDAAKETNSGGKFSIDDAVNVTLAVGMRLKQSFRLELEGSHRKHEANSFTAANGNTSNVHVEVTNTAVMSNIYYDFPVEGPLRPYVFGGLGVNVFKGEASGGGGHVTDHSNEFTHQVGGGLSYDLSDTVTADLGYHYINFERIDNKGIHEFLAGLRLGF